MDYLSKEMNPFTIKSALAKLPESQNKAFDASMKNISDRDPYSHKSKRGLAKYVISAIIHAKRPMTADEIKSSFAFQNNGKHLGRDFIESEVDWTSLCAGLVLADPETQNLSLIHESVGKYLRDKGFVLRQFETKMAETCLGYLMLEDSSPLRYEGKGSLFEYASNHWATHFQLAAQQTRSEAQINNLRRLALRFLKSREVIERSFQSIARTNHIAFVGMTGLHAATYFDLPDLAERLIRDGDIEVNTLGPEKQTALHWAIQYDRVSIINLLLESPTIDPDLYDQSKDTPLHIAIIWSTDNSEMVIQKLLERKARVDLRNSRGLTPLSWAIRYGPLSAARILIEYLNDIDEEICEGWSALRQAMTLSSEAYRTTLVDLLLDRGASLNQPSSDGWTPLKHAVQNNQQETIRRLVTRRPHPAQVKLRDPYTGISALNLALSHDLPQVAHILIEHGADVNEKFPDKSTPLIHAVKARNGNMVWKLLQEKADLNYQDDERMTALHYAIEARDRSSTWLLITHGADLSIRDNKGCSALDYAISRDDISIAWLLCEQGTVIDAANNEGRTALHMASILGYLKAVNFLLQKGAKRDPIDDEGHTPLHHAAVNRHGATVRLLVSCGADVNAKDNDGATPLHRAVQYRRMDMIQLLAGQGADLDIFDKHERTPLMLAVRHSSLNVVKELLRLGANRDKMTEEGGTAMSLAKRSKNSAVREFFSSSETTETYLV